MRRIIPLLAMLMVFAMAPSVSAAHYANTDLYTVDLETGALELVGEIGEGETLIGFALVAPSDTVGAAVGLTLENELVMFDVSSPETIDGRMDVTGLMDEDLLVGIDFRPATGELMAIGEMSVVYSIDTESGEATAVADGPFDPVLEDRILAFDFNPTVDRIRVDVSTTQNLRLNPETGLVGINPDTDEPTIDGNTVYAEGDDNADVTPRVVAAAYTENMDGAETTELFAFDAEANTFALQDPPNDGVLNTIATVDVTIVDETSFDIAPTGEAYASIPRLVDGEGTPVATPVALVD
jgi:hypothetical protein